MLGMTKVPVHIAKDFTPQQIKAYRLADNRVGQEAEWDEDLLRLELLDLEELDFDLSETGFDDDELAALMADVEEGLTDPDDVPDAPEEPVTVTGDICG
jgi:ParB-like chromosome segregation protein Spo0J